MLPEQVASAARKLTNARQAINLLESLGDDAPTNLSEAHAIAETHAEQLGWITVGWKVGCTSELAQQILNSPGPFAGRVFQGTVLDTHLLHEFATHNPGIECEFAFLLDQDLPPRDSVYSVDEVRSATLAVAPALEIVAPRFTDFEGVGYLNLVADSGANAGVVLGEPVETADCPNLADITVELDVDGTFTSSGVGNAILGDPWRSLEWLANHLSVRGIGLHAGEFVMSGTCTGIDPLQPGSVATGRYSGFGSVEVRRTQDQ